MRLLSAVALLCLLSGTAAADADAWLDGLQARVVADLSAGKPLVVQAHVPLCDNDVIPCGNARLGDGDTPARNLYWGTSEGMLGWFGRRGSGWKPRLVATGEAIGEPDVLDLRVWSVLGFARGGDYGAIRKGAAAGYAEGGDKPLRRVFGAFSNPADRRWGTPSYSRPLNQHARQHQASQGTSGR